MQARHIEYQVTVENYLWPETEYSEEHLSPANTTLPTVITENVLQNPIKKIEFVCIVGIFDEILAPKYSTCTAEEKKAIIKRCLDRLFQTNDSVYDKDFYRYKGRKHYCYKRKELYHKELFEIFSLIKNDLTPEQISTFIAHIVSKPIPAGEQDFCLTHFAPYYTPAQLHHVVDNFISVLKVSGLTLYNKRPIALEKILPNLCPEQKYKVLDFFIEEMDKAFLPDGHHREGTWEDSKLALMLCQVLDDVNQEYREKIRKRIVRLVDADHAFIYCKKVFLKCLTIGGGFFSADFRSKVIQLAIYEYHMFLFSATLYPSPDHDYIKSIIEFIDFMPYLSDKEQEKVTQYFLLQITPDHFALAGSLTEILKHLKVYFTNEEKRTLRQICEQYVLQPKPRFPSAEPVVRREAVKLLGFFMPSFPLKVQKAVIELLIEFIKQYPTEKQTFCEALMYNIGFQSPHFPFFIRQVLEYKPQLLQMHLALQLHFTVGERQPMYDMRTILEKSAEVLQLPLLIELTVSIGQAPTDQVKACLKYMYFFVKSKAVRETLQPYLSEMGILDCIDSYLHGSPYKIRPTMTFFQPAKIQNNNGILIEQLTP